MTEAHFTGNFINAEQAGDWGLAIERSVMSHANKGVSGDTISGRRAAVQQRGKSQKGSWTHRCCA